MPISRPNMLKHQHEQDENAATKADNLVYASNKIESVADGSFCIPRSPGDPNVKKGVRRKVTIDWLPNETLQQIFRFLPARSLVCSEMVCSLWRDTSKDNTYWKDLCRKQYGICPDNFVPPPDPVKMLFMLTYRGVANMKYNGGGGDVGSKIMRFL